MPHRGLARLAAAALFLAQFLVISYCERNARACWTCVRSPTASLASPRHIASHHITSRHVPRSRSCAASTYVFPSRRHALVHLRDRSRGKGEKISRFPRKKCS